MMGRYCDLHTHSTYSDGTLSPAQLIQEAQNQGLQAIALTDHNTIAGLPDFLEAAKNTEIEAIAGVEFSTEYRGKELHVLGLFIQPEHYPIVTQIVTDMMLRKERCYLEMVDKINAEGFALDYAAIKASTPNGQPNRAVIAAEMVRLGYCGSVKEAFSRWLSTSVGYYHPPQRLDVFETIRFIRSIGAVSVFAHPFLSLNPEELLQFLPQAAETGLDAMETEYVTFTPEQTETARQLADQFGLLRSGGSDFHGSNKPDIRLGVGKGNLRISAELLEKLKALI